MNHDINGSMEERLYVHSVVSTFRSYREQSLSRINYKEKCLDSLPTQHKQWLSKYKEHLQTLKQCIDKNAAFIPHAVAQAHMIFDNIYAPDTPVENVRCLSEDKVQAVFKQLMRDWSSLGAAERKQCYEPIVEEILENYPDVKSRNDINILVPGAGLGRLTYEIAEQGFCAQGNEFNVFMLLVSNYVLNICTVVDEHEIFPWVHQYCNYLKADDQMTSVRFPDIQPKLHPDNMLTMVAGDFLEVYTQSDEWHCVATCFFIDCAPNVVEFIERIYKILKPGGLWINLGPFLYHYSDLDNEKSIEPSFEILCDIIAKMGFVMEKCKTGVKTKYCQNPNSMLKYEYDSVYFVCRKPIEVTLNGDDAI